MTEWNEWIEAEKQELSKVMERHIHAYDEELKEVVKNLTIKCVRLTEQGRKLTAKVDGQQKQISRLTDKVMEQSNTMI